MKCPIAKLRCFERFDKGKVLLSMPPDTIYCEIMSNQVIPVLRIFDEAKAREFYIDWLGFTVDWEHRYEENMPLFMQVKRAEVILWLSEHHGDACPGAKIFIECPDIETYHRELLDKEYKYGRPGLETEEWGARTVTVHDPFGNRLAFFERTQS